MRLLNIIQCTNLGGMEQANLHRLCALRDAGHRVEVLSLTPLGAGAGLLGAAGIPARGLPYLGRGGWRSLPHMRAAMNGTGCDAVLMTGHNLAASLALAGRTAARRRLLALHYHHTGVKPPWQWRLIYGVAVRRFQALTFPTDFIRREAEAICPAVAPLAHTVRDAMAMPEPVEPPARAAARAALGLPDAAPVIGNAGWLIARKRFDVFLRTAARIADEVPTALFVIAGDGPERAALTALAEDLGIADRVRWLGWQSDLSEFYAAIDVLLFNSDWDALGRTPLEAVGHGVPVVASVVNGGLGELLDRPDEIPVHDRHDDAALAAEVLALLRDPEAARGRALAARRRVAAASCPVRHAERVATLLKLEV